MRCRCLAASLSALTTKIMFTDCQMSTKRQGLLWLRTTGWKIWCPWTWHSRLSMIWSKLPFNLSSFTFYSIPTLTYARFPRQCPTLVLPLAMLSAWTTLLLSLLKKSLLMSQDSSQKPLLRRFSRYLDFQFSHLLNKDKKCVPWIAQNHKMSGL